MKFIRNLIVLLLIAAAALYFTNPDKEAFSVYLADYVQEELADEHPGESELGKAFRKGMGQIAGAAGSQLAERQNFMLASVYTIDIAGTTHVFIGMAGQFIPLKDA